jgi:hypothetical protein
LGLIDTAPKRKSVGFTLPGGCAGPRLAAALGVPESYSRGRIRRRYARPRRPVVVNGYEGSRRQCNHSTHTPCFQGVSTWSGKYRSLCGHNFSPWRACSPRLESLHGRREESSSRNAREAWRSKGGKAHAAKMTREERSESNNKAAKARWAKRWREGSS